jgi:hypothetical protein
MNCPGKIERLQSGVLACNICRVRYENPVAGPVESVPGTPIQETPEQKEFREKLATDVTEAVVQDVMDASYEPERVEIPVKFESGTWPVCCNKEMTLNDTSKGKFYGCECGRVVDSEGREVEEDR